MKRRIPRGEDDGKLKAISAGAFLYSALLQTEGTGLLLRQRWAEYFTVVVAGSFIPLKLYELARHGDRACDHLDAQGFAGP